MKIFEITNRNLVWSKINDVNIIMVKETYNFLLNSLPLLIKLKSPSKSKIILSNVDNFISLVDSILTISFPDKNDEDIIKMKYELTEMKENILTLSKQLKL